MTLPELMPIYDYEATTYLDEVYRVFVSEIVDGGLTFLELPIKCPWHPAHDDKHFSFWHTISNNDATQREEDRIPDVLRCERIRWISYVIKNANDRQKVWCWEKLVRTSRGKQTHIVLYYHEKQYLVVLRKKSNRLELVTAYVRKNHQKMVNEKGKYVDPR